MGLADRCEVSGKTQNRRAALWAMPVKNQGRVGERIVRLRDMQAAASIALLLMSVSTQPGMAQQTTPQTQTNPTAPAPPQGVVSDTTGTPGLPQAPAPKLTEPLYLRDTSVDYTQPKSHFWNPIAPYTATDVPPATTQNTPRLDGLLRDGKIYLSLSDAVTLALENNYDIAIARINLDIADTDILRTKAGANDTRCFDGTCDQYARWHNHDDYKRRRSGRNNEWSGWWRRRVSGTCAEHERRRSCA